MTVRIPNLVDFFEDSAARMHTPQPVLYTGQTKFVYFLSLTVQKVDCKHTFLHKLFNQQESRVWSGGGRMGELGCQQPGHYSGD